MSARLVSFIALCLLLLPGCGGSEVPESTFRVGVAHVDVTPTLVDTWTDADGDGRYDPAAGDTFDDRDGDGAFDALALPGERRYAAGVHDSLSARALVVVDGEERLAIVAVDAYGLVFDDVEALRDTLPEAWNVHRMMVASTGTRTAPDLVSGWARVEGIDNLNEGYRAMLMERIVEAVGAAVEALRPAEMHLVEVEEADRPMLADRRPPEVFDPSIRAMRFVDSDGATIATLVNRSAPARAAGEETLTIGPDYPGALRARVEAELGGTALFVAGATGGGLEWDESGDGHGRAETVGRATAERLLNGLDTGLKSTESAPMVQVYASGMRMPLDNDELKARIRSGEIRRGLTTDSLVTTELQLAILGGAWMLAVPGEAYPELLEGGISELPEGDYTGRIEQPPMRRNLPGEVNFVFGNTNDALGPIIPLVEWDAEPPHLGGASAAHPDEARTVTPLAGSLMQRGFISVMRSAMPYYRRTQESTEE